MGIEFVEGSKFLLSEQSALKLIDAFTSIYPLMSYEFEKILPTRYKFKEVLNGWPSAVEGYKKSLDSFRELLKKQESCKHRYGKPTWTLYGFVGQQCEVCRHIRKVRKRHLKESKQDK